MSFVTRFKKTNYKKKMFGLAFYCARTVKNDEATTGAMFFINASAEVFIFHVNTEKSD